MSKPNIFDRALTNFNAALRVENEHERASEGFAGRLLAARDGLVEAAAKAVFNKRQMSDFQLTAVAALWVSVGVVGIAASVITFGATLGFAGTAMATGLTAAAIGGTVAHMLKVVHSHDAFERRVNEALDDAESRITPVLSVIEAEMTAKTPSLGEAFASARQTSDGYIASVRSRLNKTKMQPAA